jgi:transposase
MKKRRTFSREYKLEAVKKVVLQGMSYCEVARDLGIRDNLIHNWRKAFEADGTLDAQLRVNTSSDAQLNRLRDEVRQLKMERDILKKATAFFAKESR